MKCPICAEGHRPEYIIINPTQEQITRHMNKDHDIDTLAGHLLWGHPQAEVVNLLVRYMKNEMSVQELSE